MTHRTIALTLSGSAFQSPSLPGNAPSTSSLKIDVDGTLHDPSSVTSSLLNAMTKTPQSLIWTWNKASDAGSWADSTYPVAMVFGMKLINSAVGAPSKPPMTPSNIFKTPSSVQLSEKISWADNTGIVSGTSFTFLIDPSYKTATGGPRWSLGVDWSNVTASNLATSHVTPPGSSQPSKKPSLVLKYRIYCYTTSFGLWYVDPEVDLCPQG
ncbi:MAG: hypothetical protein AAGD38_18975 [Acidobacteriota bacterium]